MPLGDGTGPQGKGPRTGRGLGNCPKPSTSNPTQIKIPIGSNRGFGRGRRTK